MQTCWTWLRRKATTHTVSLRWRCGWWWRTVCLTGRPVGISGEITACSSLSPPYRTGWSAGEKKAKQHIAIEYLDDVLAEFSGYIAADELYDGPFCVLSIVDNRTFRRITYEVLDHDPTHADMERFFRTFHSALKQRGLALRGITTDGSTLYPEPISKVFGDVPHQLCEFHIIKELTKAVLRAVAKIRKELAATKPKLGRGRPSSVAARKAARHRKRIDQKVGDLFEHRYLFVRHELTRVQRRTLQRITRGRPELRTLRDIMDQVYRLFDRRCRTETALEKLARLRRRVRRFKWIGKTLQKLFSPNLEKALTFLDDKLLPSTSNAVERGYRRHRKMQKTVYRVRTQQNISSRIALDMQREERAQQRRQTTHTLHATRTRKAA
ncbi:MAG TPA: transposase [Pirellulaceae bacterium]|nr:transposase [Pirellulaceae bacterium]